MPSSHASFGRFRNRPNLPVEAHFISDVQRSAMPPSFADLALGDRVTPSDSPCGGYELLQLGGRNGDRARPDLRHQEGPRAGHGRVERSAGSTAYSSPSEGHAADERQARRIEIAPGHRTRLGGIPERGHAPRPEPRRNPRGGRGRPETGQSLFVFDRARRSVPCFVHPRLAPIACLLPGRAGGRGGVRVRDRSAHAGAGRRRQPLASTLTWRSRQPPASPRGSKQI